MYSFPWPFTNLAMIVRHSATVDCLLCGVIFLGNVFRYVVRFVTDCSTWYFFDKAA